MNTAWANQTHYDHAAARFAQRTYHLRLEEPLTRFAAHVHSVPSSHRRVLDLGCGPGRDIGFLRELGFDVIGLDGSAGMLIEGRKRGVSAPLVQADARHLPFVDHYFAGVWAMASLLHLKKADLPLALREIRRVLRGGFLYLSLKQGEGERWTDEGDLPPRFFAFYHPAEVELALERADYRVIDIWTAKELARDQGWIHAIARPRLTTPRVAANAIIFNELGQVLLTRRADNGEWCLPGGHLDGAERVDEAAVREAYEETGLIVEPEHLVGVYTASTSLHGYAIVVAAFRCRVVGGKLGLSDETTAYGWFDPAALPAPITPTHTSRIEDAASRRAEPYIRRWKPEG